MTTSISMATTSTSTHIDSDTHTDGDNLIEYCNYDGFVAILTYYSCCQSWISEFNLLS